MSAARKVEAQLPGCVQACLLLMRNGACPTPRPTQPHPHRSYHMHPGLFDACIHLAPVPPAGQPIAVTRVPVAAGALLLPPAEGKRDLAWVGGGAPGVGQHIFFCRRCRHV